jgi:hypothetical protein
VKTSNFPQGLLALLDAKSMGQTPSEVADSYAPTLECRELFLLNRQVFIGSTNTAAVNNTTVRFAELTVPPGELWYVWAFDVQSASMGAGQALRMVGQIANTSANAVAITQGRGATGAAATEQILVSAPAPFWLTAGQALGYLAEQLTGAVNVTGHALVTKLKV